MKWKKEKAKKQSLTNIFIHIVYKKYIYIEIELQEDNVV